MGQDTKDPLAIPPRENASSTEAAVSTAAKKKRKKARASKIPKIYRVTVSPRMNYAGKAVEAARQLQVRGVDTQIIEGAGEESNDFFTIIGLDGKNAYTNDAFYVRECVDLGALVNEVDLPEPALGKITGGPKNNLVPLNGGKKEDP